MTVFAGAGPGLARRRPGPDRGQPRDRRLLWGRTGRGGLRWWQQCPGGGRTRRGRGRSRQRRIGPPVLQLDGRAADDQPAPLAEQSRGRGSVWVGPGRRLLQRRRVHGARRVCCSPSVSVGVRGGDRAPARPGEGAARTGLRGRAEGQLPTLHRVHDQRVAAAGRGRPRPACRRRGRDKPGTASSLHHARGNPAPNGSTSGPTPHCVTLIRSPSCGHLGRSTASSELGLPEYGLRPRLQTPALIHG